MNNPSTEFDLQPPITAQLVLNPGNRGWVIEKFATRLLENLAAWNVQATLADQPSATADVNHWMIYHHCRGERQTPGTVLVTHVDDAEKVLMVRRSLQVADVAICLSSMTVTDLARQGIPRQQLCYITPAHDGLVSPRRVVIGIMTRVYADHRKREDVLLKVAERMSLAAFHFEIFGQGWETIIPRLEAAGATVHYDPGSEDYRRDYQAMVEHIPAFDYYLYTGLDEGSLGTLDALAAGVATIVTPQGFHLDIEGGLTHPFWDADQLEAIFQQVTAERQRRLEGVKRLTWKEYARQHAVVWRALRAGRAADLDRLLHGTQPTAISHPGPSRRQAALHRVKFYSAPVIRRLLRLVGRDNPNKTGRG